MKLKNSYLDLPDMFYQRSQPRFVESPRGLIFNHDLANELGLCSRGTFGNRQAVDFPPEFLEILSGNLGDNSSPPPIALAYCGHQFGHFTKLGDGRAHLLGELHSPQGSVLDVQLKGSGPTPFSRRGDGFAVVGPMLREYIISESMHALGVPTTRSLAVVATGSAVFREEPLPGAVLTRIASSHLRVGTVEYAAAFGNQGDLEALVDFSIRRHDSDLLKVDNLQDRYLEFFRRVVRRQIDLVVLWLKFGFIHGVMNTDNMALSGETIDYGPCAFMDRYRSGQVYSSIDKNGRYAFDRQPFIAKWNLSCLANAMLPLFSTDKETAIAQAAFELDQFDNYFYEKYFQQMALKLGIRQFAQDDKTLIVDLLKVMESVGADYSQTFCELSGYSAPINTETQAQTNAQTKEPGTDSKEFQLWKSRWINRISHQGLDLKEVEINMKKHNPVVIPRNHLVEKALYEAEKNNDMNFVLKLIQVCKHPFQLPRLPSDQLEFCKAPTEDHSCYQTFCGT